MSTGSYAGGGVDPYIDPDSGILRNKLGITDGDELALAEEELAILRDAQIAEQRIQGLYDLDHLCAFHAALFGDVYPWAGQIRTVELGKGGMQFCSPAMIETWSASNVFPIIVKHAILQGISSPVRVAACLAELLGEINALHPFREGNGRSQRAFIRQLAASAGWHIDWKGLDPAENIAASRAAMVGNHGPLQEIIAARLAPIR